MDVTFTTDNHRFKYRASAIIIENNHILLQNIKDYWAPPGGKVQLMEDSMQGVKREITEELASDIEVERPLFFVEQFYNHGDKNFHELGVYYVCRSEELWNRGRKIIGMENGSEMLYQWFKVDQLEAVNLQPVLLKEKLLHLPDTLQHIINYE